MRIKDFFMEDVSPQQIKKSKRTKFDFGNALNAFICALFLSIGLLIILTFTLTNLAGWGFFIALIGFSYWLYKTDSRKRARGRTFIGLAIESFALPIALLITIFVFVATQTEGDAMVVGGILGGMLFVGIAGVLGFFLGIIFLIAGISTLKSINKSKKEGKK